jgi:hypothetical protein
MGVSGQRHAPAALCPRKRPPVPIVQEAGWASEPVWTQRLEKKYPLSLPVIEPRSPCRPVRSQSLYWLSYPGSRFYIVTMNTFRKYTCHQLYFTKTLKIILPADFYTCEVLYLSLLVCGTTSDLLTIITAGLFMFCPNTLTSPSAVPAAQVGRAV